MQIIQSVFEHEIARIKNSRLLGSYFLEQKYD